MCSELFVVVPVEHVAVVGCSVVLRYSGESEQTKNLAVVRHLMVINHRDFVAVVDLSQLADFAAVVD